MVNVEEVVAWDPHLQTTTTIIEVLHQYTTTIPTTRIDIIRNTTIECLK